MSKNEVYDNWIADPKNREDTNARRRERYATDKNYRKKALDNAKRTRTNGSGSEVDPYQIYEYEGVDYKFYKIGYVLQKLNITIGVFNRLCNSALIPDVLLVGSHRMLTKKQVNLVGYALTNEGEIPNKAIIDKLNKEWLDQ